MLQSVFVAIEFIYFFFFFPIFISYLFSLFPTCTQCPFFFFTTFTQFIFFSFHLYTQFIFFFFPTFTQFIFFLFLSAYVRQIIFYSTSITQDGRNRYFKILIRGWYLSILVHHQWARLQTTPFWSVVSRFREYRLHLFAFFSVVGFKSSFLIILLLSTNELRYI